MNEASVRSPDDTLACRRVLVAAEGGLGLKPVAKYAMRLASPGARLKLVAVAGNPRTLFPWTMLSAEDWKDAHRAVLASSQSAVDTASRHLTGETGGNETCVVDLASQSHSAAHAIGTIARTWNASLIAMTAFSRGARGLGVWRLDPEELAAIASCPVLHLPYACLEDGRTGLARVMIAIDGSDNALDALEFAIARLPRDSHIHIVYVVDHTLGLRRTPQIRALMKAGMRALAHAKQILTAGAREGETTLIGTSEVAPSVPEAISHEADRWGADLLVLGSRGRGAVQRWLLGSVAERTLRETRRPVLVCPAFSEAQSRRAMAETFEEELDRVIENNAALPPIFL